MCQLQTAFPLGLERLHQFKAKETLCFFFFFQVEAIASIQLSWHQELKVSTEQHGAF